MGLLSESSTLASAEAAASVTPFVSGLTSLSAGPAGVGISEPRRVFHACSTSMHRSLNLYCSSLGIEGNLMMPFKTLLILVSRMIDTSISPKASSSDKYFVICSISSSFGAWSRCKNPFCNLWRRKRTDKHKSANTR